MAEDPPPPDDVPELLLQAPSAGPTAASPAMPASPLSRLRRPRSACITDGGEVRSDMTPPVAKLFELVFTAQSPPYMHNLILPFSVRCQLLSDRFCLIW